MTKSTGLKKSNLALLSAVMMLLPIGLHSQNLVPNSDFELYSPCPDNFGQLDRAVNWIMPTTGTTEYYNSCSINSSISTPGNGFGIQVPYSGNGYTGLVLWYEPAGVPEFREYMEVELIDPLTAGQCYQLQMQISFSDLAQYTTDSIGVHFSSTMIGPINNWNPLPNNPQIVFSLASVNTTSWLQLSQTFVATGNETFLTIGNFDDTVNANGTLVNPGTVFNYSYYYIDDVSLTICTGLEDQSMMPGLHIYPSIFDEYFNIGYQGNEQLHLKIYDLTLKTVKELIFSGPTRIETGEWSSGMYIYEIRTASGSIKSGKLVKN